MFEIEMYALWMMFWKKFVFDNPSSFVKKGSNNTESKKVKQIGALDYQKDTRNKKQENHAGIIHGISFTYVQNTIKKYTL